MSYRNKLIKIRVFRLTDNEPVDWYFDLNENSTAVLRLCLENPAFLRSVEETRHALADLPEGEFISDFDEFKNWLFDLVE